TSDPSSPYHLHSSNQPANPLVTQLLTDNNYPTWSRTITMDLEAKNKLGFINGTIPKPTTEPTLSAWTRCNSMVTSWLIHSTSPPIANSILWINEARAIWVDLHDCFSQKNAPRIFEIHRAIANLAQETNSISTYYTTLKALRDELSSYRSLLNCTCTGTSTLTNFFDEDYLMDFLQGLNESYASVRSQLLLMDPLPSVNKAYSLLLQEE
ncbi:UBN2_3 domain-containing protein, partial [Cephalotus follicularis]